MANDYAGQPTYSKHVTELMRRINALEAATISQRLVSTGLDDPHFIDSNAAGTEIYVSSLGTQKIHRFSSAGVLINEWTVNISGYTLGRGLCYESGVDRIFVSALRAEGSTFPLVAAYSRDGVYDSVLSQSIQDANAEYTNVAGIYPLRIDESTLHLVLALDSDSETGNGVLAHQVGVGTVWARYISDWVPYGITYIPDDDHWFFSVPLSGYVLRYEVGPPSNLIFMKGGIAIYGIYYDVVSGHFFCYVENGVNEYSYNRDSTPHFTLVKFYPAFSSSRSFGDVKMINGILHVSNSDVPSGIETTGQTTFYAYTSPTARVSLGTPDAGVSVPAINALSPSDKNAGYYPNHILDMRTRVQALAPFFKNVTTGNRFNWTASSSDNLYYKAMGDRTKYGATGGAKYDWTRTEAQMIATALYDIDIGEVYECVTLLENSAIYGA